jgi:hypothetical protein
VNPAPASCTRVVLTSSDNGCTFLIMEGLPA